MLQEHVDLFANMDSLIIAFATGAIVGSAVARYRANARRQAWKRHNHGRGRRARLQIAPNSVLPAGRTSIPLKSIDAADQLRIVMGASFSIQPLLNRSEARLFRELDCLVVACNPDWQVMAQVSLGEILRSHDAEAYACINAKRVDLLLIDANCRPRHVVEYQGGGHHQGTAAARDAVKKEALRRAGIGYHEVLAGQTTPSELKRLIENLIEKPRSGLTAVNPARSDTLSTATPATGH